MLISTILILKLSTPRKAHLVVIIRYLLFNLILRFIQKRSQVISSQVQSHCQVAFVHLPRNSTLARVQFNIAHLRQRNLCPLSIRQHQVANLLRRISALLFIASNDIIHLVFHKYLRNSFTTQGNFNQFRYIIHIQTILSNTLPIGRNLYLR